MATTVLNPLLKSAHGKLGGIVISQHGNTTRIGSAPTRESSNRRRRKPTAGEERGKQNLRKLNAYSSRVRHTNPELWARYRAKAVSLGRPVNCVSNADYSHAPEVEAIDARSYAGRPGGVIRIRAHDDFEVREVSVKITAGGTVVEAGAALRQADDSWHYLAKSPAAGTVVIEATARDWPDHAGSRKITVDLDAAVIVEPSPRHQLVEQIRTLAQRRGRYVTQEGAERVNFFDKYRLVHSPALLRGLAEQLLPLVPGDTDVLAGLELGGVPLATHVSHLTGKPLVLLRKQPRGWGTMSPAEGGDVSGRRVLIIADVVTTGQQLATAIRHLRTAGAVVTHAVCVLDEQSGAPGRLQEQGVALCSLFTTFELIA